MPLGLVLLLTLAALIGGLWLYNAWPEIRLRSLGRNLGLELNRYLLISQQLDGVRMELEHRYNRLIYQLRDLLFRFEPPGWEEFHEELGALSLARICPENLHRLQQIGLVLAREADRDVLTLGVEVILLREKLDEFLALERRLSPSLPATA